MMKQIHYQPLTAAMVLTGDCSLTDIGEWYTYDEAPVPQFGLRRLALCHREIIEALEHSWNFSIDPSRKYLNFDDEHLTDIHQYIRRQVDAHMLNHDWPGRVRMTDDELEHTANTIWGLLRAIDVCEMTHGVEEYKYRKPA